MPVPGSRQLERMCARWLTTCNLQHPCGQEVLLSKDRAKSEATEPVPGSRAPGIVMISLNINSGEKQGCNQYYHTLDIVVHTPDLSSPSPVRVCGCRFVVARLRQLTRPRATCNGHPSPLPGLAWRSAPLNLRGTASRLQNVLWNGFLTPEGSDRVPIDLRFLHDMIALLRENKIRKREVSISTYNS
jgi:hypothetical protein